MPCGSSSQVFAFTTISPTSQLSLASCMTTSALLDFATASPAFNIFLHTHCEEIVLAALRAQYGYIPETVDWDTYKLLPLYTDLDLHPHSHDTPRTIPHVPARRRHKRASRSTHDLLLELPILQRLVDEELLSEHGRKLLSFLPSEPQASTIYGPGIRGLLRYCQKYTSLSHDGTKKADLQDSMQRWLQERYSNWGIREMEFVVDTLSSRIDSLLPSLGTNTTKREQLLGSLLCGMEVLRLGDDIHPRPEEEILQRLASRGIIEFLPPPPEGNWEVTDASHEEWFSGPSQWVLSEKQLGSSDHENRQSSAESLSVEETRQYVLDHGGDRCEEGIGDDQLQEVPETREPRPSVFDVRIGPIEGVS